MSRPLLFTPILGAIRDSYSDGADQEFRDVVGAHVLLRAGELRPVLGGAGSY